MNDATRQEWLLEDGMAAERLDRVLMRLQSDLSRSRLQALIRDGQVAIDDVPVLDPNRKVAGGARITLTVPPPVPAAMALRFTSAGSAETSGTPSSRTVPACGS